MISPTSMNNQPSSYTRKYCSLRWELKQITSEKWKVMNKTGNRLCINSISPRPHPDSAPAARALVLVSWLAAIDRGPLA